MRGRDKLNDTRDEERRSTSKYGYVLLWREWRIGARWEICGELMGLSLFLSCFRNKNEGTRIVPGETIFKKKKPGQVCEEEKHHS